MYIRKTEIKDIWNLQCKTVILKHCSVYSDFFYQFYGTDMFCITAVVFFSVLEHML